MKTFTPTKKLSNGDKVAILSPSFAAPGKWPHVYELGLKRLRENFQLEPVEFPTTKKIDASNDERTQDLIAAFEDKNIQAIISSLGGNDQVTYIKNLPSKPFTDNPKPFFGYSDNTHFMNFLWLHGIPSYYGGALFTQFAESGKINEYTAQHLKIALFQRGEVSIQASDSYCDQGLSWDDQKNLEVSKSYEPNAGWFWDGDQNATGITWGGCLESIDELLRHAIPIPSLQDFENIILLTETSEEIPSPEYVRRVYRALGERGILERIKGFLVGRPKAWEFDTQKSSEEKEEYRKKQREATLQIIRQYNKTAPIVQNVDFGHTDPQIPMPYGMPVQINAENKEVIVNF
ncbi:MAG: LD-carboxypeptidase [Candidatus Moraniibacteriota bacterium]|nr:MAG: LD-carboxypeptidase [Candidatus Moranbacteria bacterium]